MVTITRPRIYPIPMPTSDEMVGLLSITRSALFPKAPPLSTNDGRVFFESFAVAFQYISTLRRSPELRDRADVWIERCQQWAHERHGEYVGVGLSAFMCGIAAAGDVDYRLDPARWPHDIYCGLAWNEGPTATPTGWIRVLKTKAIRPSIPAPKNLHPEPRPLIFYPSGG
jgi:hypothetical protein